MDIEQAFSKAAQRLKFDIDKTEKNVYYINMRRGNGSTVERHLPKVNVAGSNPVFRSRKER